jgi:hypothetical protein
MGDVRNANKILAGKPRGKRSFGRTRHTWEDNIIADLKAERDEVGWIKLAQTRVPVVVLLNTVMILWFL